ncbi:Zn-dependent alcohol dehydrogenase [Arthrobacter globiformis]|uniref:Zn-dependent alcohol dehydrogenase n=1 Tax=Arthrobacter globiformis TaxID=1665 RepID=UPI00278D2091|nr:Zn-dependent alcohol dehydrogenase [Arthrobacter globiformis]MDQ0616708.1 S-(hydroxymethyl)glutathione dehydrogenase/alcohol dehydrogenase [Arthrobacter globiformis]
MKAAVVDNLHGQFQVQEITLDDPAPHEVRVKVEASGLCHTDLHFVNHDLGTHWPAVLGHEVAGTVQSVGSEVTEFEAGDHVVASLIQYCGHCMSCLEGRSYQCGNPEETQRAEDQPSRLSRNGAPINQAFGLGGFAAEILTHRNQLAKVPKGIPFSRAALLGCGVITGAGAAINTAGVRPGDSVAVIGVGGVGLSVLSGARLAGAATIIAIDVQPSKLDLAKKFGATHVINSADVDVVKAVREITGGGSDHSFEVVGLKQTAEDALSMARMGGSAYLIGVQQPGRKIEVDVMTEMIFGQKKIQGIKMGSTNIKKDIPRYAQLYLDGQLNLDDLISQEISLRDINDAYKKLEGGAIARSVITSFD